MRFLTSLVCLLGFFASTASGQSWQYIAPMKHARSEALAFVLKSGKILVAGGRDDQNALASCELYDPLTDTWADAAPLNIARLRYRGFVMSDGRVFIAGGLLQPGTSLTPTTSTCEIYDPQTDRWTLTASMSSPREGFLACQLPGNKIALMAGLDANTAEYTRTFDIYDCETETMTTMPALPSCTFMASAVYNPAMNSIVVVGGLGQGYGGYIWKSVQCFSLARNTWSLLDSLHAPQAVPYAIVYNPFNSTLVVYPTFTDYNGSGTSEIEVIDHDGHIHVPSHTQPRVVPESISVGDSALFLSGIGSNQQLLATCEWYDFRTEQISSAPPLKEPMKDQAVAYYLRSDPMSPCTDSRIVYIFGGVTPNGATRNCEALTWTTAKRVTLPQLSLSVTPCSALDTNITIRNPGCDGLQVVAAEGNSLLRWGDTSVSVAPNDSVRLSLHGSGFSSSGIFTLPLHLTQYGKSWDTSVTVILDYRDQSRTPIRAMFKDVLGTHVGDTISVPLYLRTSLESGDDLSLVFCYNTNMLQMLAPSFDNVAMNTSAYFDFKERRNVATLDFPGTVTLSNSQPFVVLHFRVLLTDTTRSELTLQSVNLGSSVLNGCVALQTTSALITTDLQCGEGSIYELLHNGTVAPLQITQSRGEIRISLPKGAESIRLYDDLGRVATEQPLSQRVPAGDITLHVSHSGSYSIVVTTHFGVRTARIVVVR